MKEKEKERSGRAKVKAAWGPVWSPPSSKFSRELAALVALKVDPSQPMMLLLFVGSILAEMSNSEASVMFK
jgi:hypothetical protein